MEQSLVILPSVCDNTAHLSYPAAFSLFMDAATEHADAIGVGIGAMSKKNLFWLTVRTKVRFHRRPQMMQRVTVATWPGLPERMRCERYYTLSAQGELLVEGKTEWAVINTATGRLQSVMDIYPDTLQFTGATACDGAFERISEDFSGAEELASYTVKSTDIDMGGHMNNAAYLRVLFGAFSCRALQEMPVSDVDAAFRSPCYEGDTLSIRCRETDAGREIGFLRHDGKTAFVARITG